MDTLKPILFNRFKVISLLTASMALSIILLMVRMKLTHSFFFLFLVWNLFLAVIPYTITAYLSSKATHHKLVFLCWFVVWLLFLPNAPYIITDLLHLKISANRILWLDVLVVVSFTYNGLLLYFLSLADMEYLLSKHLKKSLLKYIMPCLFLLTAFGMYLGRFLRYNSWEIVNNPMALLNDIVHIIIFPTEHVLAWCFTIGFSMFLALAYSLFKSIPKQITP